MEAKARRLAKRLTRRALDVIGAQRTSSFARLPEAVTHLKKPALERQIAGLQRLIGDEKSWDPDSMI